MVKTCHIPIALCILILSCGRPEDQAATEVAASVTVMAVSIKPIEEFITAAGTVAAIQSTDVKSETSGLYHPAKNPRTGRPFAIGDEVKKGEALVNLESDELENSVKIESAKLNLDLTRREYEKQKSLYEKGGVTLSDLNTSEKSLIDAKYSYESALIQLAKLKITAPLDGIITDWTSHPVGVKIDSGESIARIMNYRRLIMDASLPGKHLGRVRVNMEARITNINLSGIVFRGKITQVSPALDSSTRAFKTTLEIENPGGELKPGMFVKAEIVVDRHESAVVIPKDVIMTQRQNRVVYVVERGLAVERPVKTGLENAGEVEITEGLSVDDRLVVKGFETLRNRAKVKVSE